MLIIHGRKADKSTLSWLAYGYEFKFFAEPARSLFANPPTCAVHEEFIAKEHAELLSKGPIQEVEPSEVHCCHPMSVVFNGSGKLRRVDDMRYVNASLVSPS